MAQAMASAKEQQPKAVVSSPVLKHKQKGAEKPGPTLTTDRKTFSAGFIRFMRINRLSVIRAAGCHVLNPDLDKLAIHAGTVWSLLSVAECGKYETDALEAHFANGLLPRVSSLTSGEVTDGITAPPPSQRQKAVKSIAPGTRSNFFAAECRKAQNMGRTTAAAPLHGIRSSASKILRCTCGWHTDSLSGMQRIPFTTFWGGGWSCSTSPKSHSFQALAS